MGEMACDAQKIQELLWPVVAVTPEELNAVPAFPETINIDLGEYQRLKAVAAALEGFCAKHV